MRATVTLIHIEHGEVVSSRQLETDYKPQRATTFNGNDVIQYNQMMFLLPFGVYTASQGDYIVIGNVSVTTNTLTETLKNYEAYTKRFALFVSERHREGLALPLFFVTYDDVLAFLQMIEDNGNKDRTWNEYLAHIKRLFRVLYPKTGVYEKLSNLRFKTENNTLHKIFEKKEIV